MPDVQEVFRMSTQKVRQEPGAMERQLTRQRRAARNRKAGTFAVVGAIVALAIVVISNVDRSEAPRVATNPPPITAQTGPYRLDVRTGEMSPLSENIAGGFSYPVSPDGTMFAYNPCCEPPVGVFVANIDGTAARQVTPDGVDAYGARWLPDGDALVFQGRNGSTEEIGNLFVVDVATGDTTRITDLDPTSSPSWFLAPEPSPDGQSVLFHLPRDSSLDPRWDLWSVPVEGGELTLVRRNAGSGVYAPDGNGEIAFLDAPQDFSSPVLSLAAGPSDRPRVLARGDAIQWPQWSPDGTSVVYADGTDIHIVDISTGTSSVVAEGGRAEWFDDDTLVVSPAE